MQSCGATYECLCVCVRLCEGELVPIRRKFLPKRAESSVQSGFRASFGKINVCNQSRHNEGSHSASHSAMLGLDYSSSDEDGDDTTKVHAPTVAAEADKRGGEAGETPLQKMEGARGASNPGRTGAGVSSASDPRPSTILPSAFDLLEATGPGGVGSMTQHYSRPGPPGGRAQHSGTAVTGVKRPASGQFPLPSVPQKSGRGGQQRNVSGKPVNTLLPPQLRGRANNATQDLEALGFKRKPS